MGNPTPSIGMATPSHSLIAPTVTMRPRQPPSGPATRRMGTERRRLGTSGLAPAPWASIGCVDKTRTYRVDPNIFGPYSSAADFVRPTTPCFAALYAVAWGAPPNHKSRRYSRYCRRTLAGSFARSRLHTVEDAGQIHREHLSPLRRVDLEQLRFRPNDTRVIKGTV